MISGRTGNIHLVAPECNGQPGFQRSEPPAPTEGASLTTSENDKARTWLSRPIPATPFRPPSARRLKSGRVYGARLWALPPSQERAIPRHRDSWVRDDCAVSLNRPGSSVNCHLAALPPAGHGPRFPSCPLTLEEGCARMCPVVCFGLE